MWARIATGNVHPGKMDDFIKIFNEAQRPIFEQAQGFQSVRLLTSPSKAVAVSIWATESDAQASMAAGRALEDLVKRFEGVMDGPPAFEQFEVSADY